MTFVHRTIGFVLDRTQPTASRSRVAIVLGQLSNPAVKVLSVIIALCAGLSPSADAQSVSWNLGSDVFVGDNFTVNVTGADANSSIQVCAIDPYPSSGGCANGFGPTNSSGNWTETGTIPPGSEGAWYEPWKSYPSLNTIGELDFYVHPSCYPSLDTGDTSIGNSYDYWSGSPGFGGTYLGSSLAYPLDVAGTVGPSCHFTNVYFTSDGRLDASLNGITTGGGPGCSSSFGGCASMHFADTGYTGFGGDQAGNYPVYVEFDAEEDVTSQLFYTNLSVGLSVWDD